MAQVRSDWNEVQVRASSRSGRCYYSGLMACGSVWACPVCAAKIQQVRVEEVRRAIDAAAAQGLAAWLLTVTVPHTRHDDLTDLLKGFTGSLSAMFKDRRWRELVSRYGIGGYIRALEVSWGEASGWHPHAHLVVFVRKDADLDRFADELWPVWQNAVANRGLGEASRAAFSLQDGTHVSRYLTKMGDGNDWGPAEELVRSHTKSAAGARFSPFDLLGEVAYGEHEPGVRARFAVLFRTYTEAFHGRRQLQWSRGLKHALLGAEGPTDAEIADSLGELDPVLATITLNEWARIRARRLQGELLLVAELHGRPGILNFLLALKPWPPPAVAT